MEALLKLGTDTAQPLTTYSWAPDPREHPQAWPSCCGACADLGGEAVLAHEFALVATCLSDLASCRKPEPCDLAEPGELSAAPGLSGELLLRLLLLISSSRLLQWSRSSLGTAFRALWGSGARPAGAGLAGLSASSALSSPSSRGSWGSTLWPRIAVL